MDDTNDETVADEENNDDGSKENVNVKGENHKQKQKYSKNLHEDDTKIGKFISSLVSASEDANLFSSDEQSSSQEYSGETTTAERIRESWRVYYAGEAEEGEESKSIWEPEKVEEEQSVAEEVQQESPTSSEALSTVYQKLSPFTILWSFGVNKSVGLLNLTTPKNFEVLYATSHFGVLYNYAWNTMTFFPGHNCPITSISSDASGRWIVTADAGNDTVIIVWDKKKKVPAWALYDVFPKQGVSCARISQDARFLAAINCSYLFSLKFWMWTLGRTEPDGEVTFEATLGEGKNIAFNHMKTEQFAVTLEYKTIFCEWVKAKKKIISFSPNFRFIKKKFGSLRETIFLDDNHTALTSTATGYLVVWCDVKYTDPISEEIPGTIEKKFLKSIKIQKKGITSLRLSDKSVVTSSEDGTILFHDQYLRLMYCLPKLKLDPICSLSFHINPVPCECDPFSSRVERCQRSSFVEEIENVVDLKVYNDDDNDFADDDEDEDNESESDDDELEHHDIEKFRSNILDFENADLLCPKKIPSDCTVEMLPFCIRDFLFLTKTGKIGYISHRRKKVKYYLNNIDAPILAIDCSPTRSQILVGNSVGQLWLYEYNLKKLIMSVTLESPITTLKYSYLGHFLLVGLQNGTIIEMDPLILKTVGKLNVSKSPIRKICLSQDDKILAFYDQNSMVQVFVKNPMRKWTFLGRYISHYKPIRDILFEETPKKTKNPRLFTIGEDRMLVEYDMEKIEEHELQILSTTRIEQTAIPYCFTWLPHANKPPQFIISNNEFKLKILDSSTCECQKTTLGPTADTPITFMKVIIDKDKKKEKTNEKQQEGPLKMIYGTQRHIGIRLLPPTGNPFEGIGLVAHPEKIGAIAISHDFKHIFTIGVNDATLLMWSVNIDSVDVASQVGGTGLEPFTYLIEGGSSGFLFKEIEDFFYYAQIIHQGEDPNVDRLVSKNLALCEIPDLFRSLGYYPTNYEINNILYELRQLNFEKTGQLAMEVSFEECVKAFLNHRPVLGTRLDDINMALLAIADVSDPSDITVAREELYHALEIIAEGMSHAEAVGYLNILLLPPDENNPVPPDMPLYDFARDVLGIDLTISEEQVTNIVYAFEKE